LGCEAPQGQNIAVGRILFELGKQMVAWTRSDTLVEYPDALAAMEGYVAGVRAGTAPELLWFLEHPPLYTAGTSAKPSDLLQPDRFPVFEARRGGEYTYHGPGQRVVYAMLDLERRGRDIRHFVAQLEAWVIETLAAFNLRGEIRDGRVGVWIARPDKPPLPDGTPREDKIAAIGLRVRKWVSFHGISINVEPDLSHFDGIVPCGIQGHGVTSLMDLGQLMTIEDVDSTLLSTFADVFGDTPEGPVAPPIATPPAQSTNR
jgi:lipoyl(octanoyl) transferase